MSAAVFQTATGVVCSQEVKGNILHRFCADESDEEPEVAVRERFARWQNGLNGIEDHVATLGLEPTPIRVPTLDDGEDLSIR